MMKFWQKKIFYIYGYDRDYFCEWEEYFIDILWRLGFWDYGYCDRISKFYFIEAFTLFLKIKLFLEIKHASEIS